MNGTTYEPMADEAIRLYKLCKHFKSLPVDGGILAQDYLQMWLLEVVADAVGEKEQRDLDRAKNMRK